MQVPAKISSLNPATEELLAEFPLDSSGQIREKLERAHGTFLEWRRTMPEQRSAAAYRIAKALRKNAAACARQISLEMGKRFEESQSEIEKCAVTCETLAEMSAAAFAESIRASDAQLSYVRYEPLGTVLGVMPWNLPFWQVIRFAIPAILAGNTVLLKHASNVTACALMLQKIFEEADVPRGLFQVLVVASSEIEGIIKSPEIAAVSLTGSEGAGRTVAAQCGQALKKFVLELGGSDPFIILPDADLPLVVDAAIHARLQANGQSCIAAKRFLIPVALLDEFSSTLQQKLSRLKVGDPFDDGVDLGPLAKSDVRNDLESIIESARQAKLRCIGGERPFSKGYFLNPAIITFPTGNDRARTASAWQEETFGPVFSLIGYKTEEEAIALANESKFGLGASLWSADTEKAQRLAAELECGMTFINAMVKSDPRIPFGGIKASGIGRELGVEGLREFTNVKTVYVHHHVA